MFSYRHAFHAGNHADVLKHTVLVQLIDYLKLKDKGFVFVDTHAGAGEYALDAGFAAKRREFETGITRVWSAEQLPSALESYRAQVRACNTDDRLRIYPGSPRIAMQMLREQDHILLFELHSTESQVLRAFAQRAGRRVMARALDGFAGLKSVLPPPTRRGVVLIDPSYEDKDDYRAVIAAMKDALKRFATGTYAVWYPVIARDDATRLPGQLQQLASADWLNVSLTVSAPPSDGLGLFGSGMFVFNPPWTLPASLKEAMPVMLELLRQDNAANYTLDFNVP